MRALALIEAPNHVCYRYRIEAYAPALAARGWTLESLPLDPQTFARNRQLREAASYDVVILQRKLLPLWQLRLLRKAARVLIYDFDDALFHRDSYARKGPSSVTRLAHFWATIYAADAVIAGNAYLAEQASAYVVPERVHLLPTCVTPSLYSPARHERRGAAARLVWIGQHSTLPCLDHASEQLSAAAEQLPGLRLHVVSNRFPVIQGPRVVERPWSAMTETAELAGCDIGISWLPDDPWSRGKCGLKVLQYMAAGLPVVANPLGMNREMVLEGQTGLLASTPREWAAAIARLANDPALRARLGAAGRRLVEEQYSAQSWGERFAGLLEQVWHDSHHPSPTAELFEPVS
ncbi:MAG: glycosyltransferase family 4 protein [Pirellulales bacterium]|nr:glycosyltransferase family 4 protein [Pirellulales bacterium]